MQNARNKERTHKKTTLSLDGALLGRGRAAREPLDGREARDAKLLADAAVLVGVDLGDDDAALELRVALDRLAQLLVLGRHALAVPAPLFLFVFLCVVRVLEAALRASAARMQRTQARARIALSPGRVKLQEDVLARLDDRVKVLRRCVCVFVWRGCGACRRRGASKLLAGRKGRSAILKTLRSSC